MSNLNQALYKMVSKYISLIKEDLETYITDGCTFYELQQLMIKVNHIQDMMDVVLGDDTNER